MIERRFRRRALLLLAIPVAALAFVVSVRVAGPENRCRTPDAAPREETRLMPPGLSLDRIGTVTRVRRDDRHITVQAFTTKPIGDAAVLLQDAVVAAGYRPAGMDSEEGIEAEVFFTTGAYAAGQARVRSSGCDDGRSDIELVLLDRNAVP
jgi:hypothetical protein